MKIRKENKLEKYNNEEIYVILKEAKSFSSVLRTFGYNSITTGNYKYVKKILKNREIEVPVYNYFNENINFNRKSNEEMFSKNSTSNRNHIKNRIIKENLMKYECECGNTGEWQGKKLVLQLEHKNGDTLDNRLENLTFLCPNCHSQTSTFSGRNAKKLKKEKDIKKCKCGKNIHSTSINCADCNSKKNRQIDRPSYEQLKREIGETSQYNVSKKYNVSWRTIKKWLIYYEKPLEQGSNLC